MSFEAIEKEYQSSKDLPWYGSLNTMRRLCGDGKVILDVGCASGYLGAYLKKQDNTVYGIDGNASALEKAKKIYREVACVDLNRIDFQKQVLDGASFDVIVFADVLEHLLDPEGVLEYFRKFLKPNGKIVVSLPNVALWRVRFNLLFGKFEYTDYGVLDRTHLHLYTFRTAKDLVEKAGFKTISIRSAENLWIFGVLIEIMPWLRSLLGIHIVIEAKPNDDR